MPSTTRRRIDGNGRPFPETVLSLFILGVIIVIMALVLHVQQTFSPAVEVAMGLHQPPSEPSTPPAVPDTLDLALPEAVVTFGSAETFLPATLSDKINGKAELYLKAGFVRLDAQRFRVLSVPDAWIEMSAYTMAHPEAAFSVYSLQRRDSGRPMDDLPQAYATENAVFLHHGHFYLELVASTASETVAEHAIELARRFTVAHPVSTTGEPMDKTLFPEAGLDVNSIQLIPANAFGYDAFNDVLVATYRISGTELTAFLTRRSSPDEAVRLKTGYGDFLSRFGAVQVDRSESVSGSAVYDMMGFFEIIFATDHYLAGIHEADDLLIAERLALELYQRIHLIADERRASP